MMVLLSPSISSLRPSPRLPPMDFAAKSALFRRPTASLPFFFSRDRRRQRPREIPAQIACRLLRFPSLAAKSHANYSGVRASFTAEAQTIEPVPSGAAIARFWKRSLRILAFGALAACGVLAAASQRATAASFSVAGADVGFLGHAQVALRGAWPKILQVLQVFKEQGLILAALLGLSAFFSMAETSITTLWPWKVNLHYIKEEKL